MDRHPIDGRPVFVSRCEDRSTGIKSAPQFKVRSYVKCEYVGIPSNIIDIIVDITNCLFYL